MSGTSGGEQGRSSWRGGRRRRSTGRRPVRKKRPTKWVFFSGSHFVLDASSGSGLTQHSPTCPVYLSSIFVGQLSYTWIGATSIQSCVGHRARRNGDPVGRGGAPKAQYRPKAGNYMKKKRPTKWVFFFWFPLRKRCSIEKGVNRLFPAQ